MRGGKMFVLAEVILLLEGKNNLFTEFKQNEPHSPLQKSEINNETYF